MKAEGTHNKKQGISLKYFLPLFITLILATAVLLIFVGIVYFIYQNDIRQQIQNQTNIIELIKTSLYNTETPPTQSPTQYKQAILSQAAQGKEIIFLRIIHPKTGRILFSAKNPEEVGQIIDQSPQFFSQPTVYQNVRNNLPLKEITILGSANEGIWMGLDFTALRQSVLTTTARMTFTIIILFSLIYILLYHFFNKSLIIPLINFSHNIKQWNQGKQNAKISAHSKVFKEINQLGLGLNKIQKDLCNIRQRDIVISRLKTEFISIAAHQLRTPLSIIKWIIKLLIDGDAGPLTKEQTELLEKGYRTNERMIQLIEDLLHVSRIEEGRFGYTFMDTNLVQLIEQAIQEQSSLAKKNNIQIIFHKHKISSSRIKADPQKIKLALANLLTNAIKYSHRGGKVKITIEPYQTNYLRVSIKDKGIGIPKDQLKRLFSKFFRGRNAIQKETNGSGLGLFIVKNIINRHGGKIWAQSKENDGSTFYFTLPSIID